MGKTDRYLVCFEENIRTDEQPAVLMYLYVYRHSGSSRKVHNLRSESIEIRLLIREVLIIKNQSPTLNNKKSAIKLHLFSRLFSIIVAFLISNVSDLNHLYFVLYALTNLSNSRQNL